MTIAHTVAEVEAEALFSSTQVRCRSQPAVEAVQASPTSGLYAAERAAVLAPDHQEGHRAEVAPPTYIRAAARPRLVRVLVAATMSRARRAAHTRRPVRPRSGSGAAEGTTELQFILQQWKRRRRRRLLWRRRRRQRWCRFRGQEVGAGGGGSGFVASNATNVVSLSGNTGDGSIVITYDEPKDTTTLEVKASDNPNDATATTLTAVVSPATATGSVTFTDGSTELGSATLTDGVATLSKTLASGTHTITASYSGDAAYGTSTTSTKVTVTAYSAPSFDTDSTADAPIEKNVVAGQSFSFDDLVATGVPGPTYSVENDDSDDRRPARRRRLLRRSPFGTTTHAGTWQIMVTATTASAPRRNTCD